SVRGRARLPRAGRPRALRPPSERRRGRHRAGDRHDRRGPRPRERAAQIPARGPAGGAGAVKGIVHDQSASGQTVFIEPLEILEANNVLREAELAERSEVVRILDELSRRVERAADDLEAVTTALGALDLALAKAFYADALEASRPALNADGILDLIDARHPLL